MKYILVTHDRLRFILDEGNYASFLKAIKNNDKAYVVGKYKTVIPLHITPTVMPFEIWYAQENEKLAMSGKRLCKKCLSIMEFKDGCICWKMKKGEKKNAFIGEVPQMAKDAINKIAESKSFPKVSQLDVDLEEKPDKRRLKTGSDGGGDFYLDEHDQKIYQ